MTCLVSEVAPMSLCALRLLLNCVLLCLTFSPQQMFCWGCSVMFIVCFGTALGRFNVYWLDHRPPAVLADEEG